MKLLLVSVLAVFSADSRGFRDKHKQDHAGLTSTNQHQRFPIDPGSYDDGQEPKEKNGILKDESKVHNAIEIDQVQASDAAETPRRFSITQGSNTNEQEDPDYFVKAKNFLDDPKVRETLYVTLPDKHHEGNGNTTTGTQFTYYQKVQASAAAETPRRFPNKQGSNKKVDEVKQFSNRQEGPGYLIKAQNIIDDPKVRETLSVTLPDKINEESGNTTIGTQITDYQKISEEGKIFEGRQFKSARSQTWSEVRHACIWYYNTRDTVASSIESCKTKCEVETTFICRSIDYQPSRRRCVLTVKDSSSGAYKEPCPNGYQDTLFTEKISVCGGVFSHVSGTIVHPMVGGNYQNDEDCVWVINAGQPIQISFTSFQVETNYDFLQIRDGDSSGSSNLGLFTGHTLPEPVQTSGNAAYLQFTSDVSVYFPGFELHWGPTGCGEVYTASNGVIRHPLSAGNYANDENCIWKINASEPIKITIVRLDLETDYDFIYVQNGPSSDSPVIGSYTGSTIPNSVQTTQNSAHLLFSSDYSVTETGFEIRWEPATTVGPSDCACGQVNRAARIVNGVETEVNEYPWQAGMVSTSSSYVWCGGSVIGSKHVLTAAHCTAGETASGVQVLVGAHRLSSPTSSQIRLDVARFIDHPNYDTPPYDNDISIIELSSSIDLRNSEIRPVCLPANDDNTYESVTATVSGWGTLEFKGDSPDVLMEVDVPTMNNAKCSTVYGDTITDNMLCAGYDEGGKDSCQGDSGGPLYYNPGAGHIQIGVVSFGGGCALPGVPGVYARVTKYLTWISDNTASSNTCPSAKVILQ